MPPFADGVHYVASGRRARSLRRPSGSPKRLAEDFHEAEGPFATAIRFAIARAFASVYTAARFPGGRPGGREMGA